MRSHRPTVSVRRMLLLLLGSVLLAVAPDAFQVGSTVGGHVKGIITRTVP